MALDPTKGRGKPWDHILDKKVGLVVFLSSVLVWWSDCKCLVAGRAVLPVDWSAPHEASRYLKRMQRDLNVLQLQIYIDIAKSDKRLPSRQPRCAQRCQKNTGDNWLLVCVAGPGYTTVQYCRRVGTAKHGRRIGMSRFNCRDKGSRPTPSLPRDPLPLLGGGDDIEQEPRRANSL